MKFLGTFLLLAFFATAAFGETLQLLFTSDPHYGLVKEQFQGAVKVDSALVNQAMIKKMNGLSALVLPVDGGVGAGSAIGSVEYLIEGGDIANREEGEGAKAIQSATKSWSQFEADYLHGLTLKNKAGLPTAFLLLPGNHDITNAIGNWRVMTPPKDPTAFLNIYNYMLKPAAPLTAASYNFAKDRIDYSKDIGGVHFLFVQMWPDNEARAWIDADLAKVPARTPVVLFTHANPSLESKYYTNPNGKHDMNNKDKFENVVDVTFSSGTKIDDISVKDERDLAGFLKKHPNILAWFHGHVHINQFYDWTGPDHDVRLSVVSVDSPMKGMLSAKDEKKLSFQLISLDTETKDVTIRECLWNADPANPDSAPVFGGSETLGLTVAR
jgi:3',5'-cyclic AMP phosphodiesterase CpdA